MSPEAERPLRAVPDLDDKERLAAVFARVRGGSEEAFAELYDLTSARIYGLVLSVIRAPELAAEVTQEAFVEVWRQAARWDPDKGSVRAWMNAIAHHKAVDKVRSTRRQFERDGRWASTGPAEEPDETWEAVEQRLQSEEVRSALGRLSELQREAVSLTYFGGHSQREVADMLGLPLGTVKTRIRDGLSRLRASLGGVT